MSGSAVIVDEPAPPAAPPAARGRIDRSWLIVAAIAAVLVVPVIVTLGVLHSPHYFPLLDLAQTELRIRDVWSAHPPLIGLPGRIGHAAHQGSHPGPLSFYALFPFYELYGRSAFAMQAASASLHVVAWIAALVIARRRGGTPLVVAIGCLLAILMASYGGAILTEAWNPYLPLSWWFLFLLAAWSVLCGDVVLLPVVTVAASFCAQTHLPYLGIAGAMTLLVFVAVGVTAWRHRADVAARARAVRWSVIAIVLGALLWVPPIYEQLTTSPGNLRVVGDDIRHPRGPLAGYHAGLQLLLRRLNPIGLISNRGVVPTSVSTGGTTVPGVILLLLWVAAFVVAWRMRDRVLLWLHSMLAVALVLAAYSISHISGTLLYYLVLWAWGITAFLLFAVIATAVAWLRGRLDAPQQQRWTRYGVVTLVVITLVSTAFFVDEAAYTEIPNPGVTHTLAVVATKTVAALDSGRYPGGGRNGRYLVTWDDVMAIGARGYGLFDELERQRFHVGTNGVNEVGARPYRVMKPKDATAEVHLVSGVAIDRFARKPGEQLVAYDEPRTPAQRAASAQLRAKVIAELEAAGRHSDAQAVAGDNFLGVAEAVGTAPAIRAQLVQLLTYGVPVAVFVGPPPRS